MEQGLGRARVFWTMQTGPETQKAIWGETHRDGALLPIEGNRL